MNGTHAIYRNRALAQSLSVIIELNRMVVVLSAVVLIAGNLEANNLTISNTSLTGQNVSAGANHPDNYTMVQFDLSWENSWRHGTSPSGMVEALFIRTGGSGYTDGTHTISFSGGGATTDATASVTVSGGIITSINSFTQGAGYTSPPTAFTGAGPGSGAVFDPHIHPWWDAAWVFVKFRVSQNYVSAPGATNSGSTVTVGSTEGLRPGMVLRVTSGAGAFANGTVVSSVTSATTFVASSAPSAALASSAVVTGYPVWEHALFHENGHQAPSGSSISTGLVSPGTAFHASTNPGVGVFIHRENPGTGTFTANGTQLRWNYGASGLRDDDLVDFKVFGIEMVYVPGAPFYVSGAYTYPTTSDPYYIATEDEIAVGTTSGNLYYTKSSQSTFCDQSGPIPANYPKGYLSFYCMKYELTQGQYIDFLNILNREQQNARTGTILNFGLSSVTQRFVMSNTTTISKRNGIRCHATIHPTDTITFYCDLNNNGIGNESTDGQSLAANHMSWYDHAAYMDWSGLRPMSEFEFEKACRGPMPVIAGEFAWGTTQRKSWSPYTILGSGSLDEGVVEHETAPGIGNAVYQGSSNIGPFRVGLFALNTSNHARVSAGSSYYGIMELSGNVWEYPVIFSSEQGRAFEGTHGDGILDKSGFANVSTWPSSTSGSNVLGAGLRGGTFQTNSNQLIIGDRYYASHGPSNRPDWSSGGRGVRSEP